MNSSSDNSSASLTNEQETELKQRPREGESTLLDPDAIREAAEARAKDRPILQKLVEKIRKEKRAYREVIINSEPLEKRVAVLNEGGA